MHAKTNVFDAVSNDLLILLDWYTLPLQECQDVDFEGLQHCIKFHPNLLRSMQQKRPYQISLSTVMVTQSLVMATESSMKW